MKVTNFGNNDVKKLCFLMCKQQVNTIEKMYTKYEKCGETKPA